MFVFRHLLQVCRASDALERLQLHRCVYNVIHQYQIGELRHCFTLVMGCHNNQTGSPRMVPVLLEACVDYQILGVLVRNRQAA